MKKVSIEQLTGGEKLAKEITTDTGLMLIPRGSIIKKEYIAKMRELHIDTVYIEYEEVHIDIDDSSEEKIQMECKNMVKETLEKYSYSVNAQLNPIVTVAENIIQDILSEPQVMYNISLVREKSESTYCHCINVSALSVLIALRMEMDVQHVREIAVGALLHDLGIVYLPAKYQDKTYDEYDEKEKEIIRNHVITGYSMVESEEWLSPISKEIILSHHERMDGSGYPMHLKAPKIKIETMIVALCDEFDALVYGCMVPQLKVHRVIDYITSQAGRKFDFEVVNHFLASVAAYPIGTYVKTNTNETAIVVKQNNKMPTRPVIQLITKEKEAGKILDLTSELTVFIVDTIDIS